MLARVTTADGESRGTAPAICRSSAAISALTLSTSGYSSVNRRRNSASCRLSADELRRWILQPETRLRPPTDPSSSTQLLFEPLTTLHCPELILAVQPELRVETIERSQVGFELLRKFVGVTERELVRQSFLAVELAFDVGELAAEKRDRPASLTLPRRRVFLDVEADERVRHLRDGPRIPALVAEREGDRHRASAGLVERLSAAAG